MIEFPIMQFAVIAGPSESIATPRIRLANTLKDGVELRLDLFKRLSFDKVEIMRRACTKKIIFTLRRKSSGGGFTGSEEARLSLLGELLTLKPDYVDLEYDTDLNYLKTVESKIITSYHDFKRTPKDLEALLQKMQNPYAYAYKICTTATTASDAFRMLKFIQSVSKKGVKIIGLCMGEEGKITREDGVKAGNYLNYTILHKHDNCARGLHFTLDFK